MSLSPSRFHVRSYRLVSPESPSKLRSTVALYCTVCGGDSPMFGMDGDAVLLSDFITWQDQHTCPGLRVT